MGAGLPLRQKLCKGQGFRRGICKSACDHFFFFRYLGPVVKEKLGASLRDEKGDHRCSDRSVRQLCWGRSHKSDPR